MKTRLLTVVVTATAALAVGAAPSSGKPIDSGVYGVVVSTSCAKTQATCERPLANATLVVGDYSVSSDTRGRFRMSLLPGRVGIEVFTGRYPGSDHGTITVTVHRHRWSRLTIAVPTGSR